MGKTILTVLFVSIFTIGSVGILWRLQKEEDSRRAASAVQPARPSKPQAAPSPSRQPRAAEIPAYQTGESLTRLPQTLLPDMFNGSVRSAYQIAVEIPRTLAQVPCYCKCDRSLGHKSLLSCYADDHASKCGICINEAFSAYRLEKEQKLRPEQIREKIIAEYSPKS